MVTLFDSNVLIYYMKGLAEAHVAVNAASSARISRITWIEIMSGIDHSDQALMAEATVMLAMFEVIEMTPQVAALAAQILSERTFDRLASSAAKSAKFRPPDAIIQATAMLHASKLVTNNIKDFKDVRCYQNVLIEPLT